MTSMASPMTGDETVVEIPLRRHRRYRPPARLQRRRRLLQAAFFLLFVAAPPLDIFRLDLVAGHFVFFGQAWTLGLDPLLAGAAGGGVGAGNIVLRGLLPLLLVVGGLGWVAWRYGRLYCGWLCPHFSVVELINGLMRRASGKPSLWERVPLPRTRPDGRVVPIDRRYWPLALAAVLFFGFLWALVLLTYLLPPAEIYGNLVHGDLTRNQTIFLSAATGVFSAEFLLARHLFCRFGCAVGVFQSLVWMGNRRAMVVGFDRTRARACDACDNACEHACPMRLKPRTIKRRMFTCTECGQCLAACEDVQRNRTGRAPLLQWVRGACALDVSARDFGHKPAVPRDCYRR